MNKHNACGMYLESERYCYSIANGTIIFVHGTGVRLKSYQSGFETAAKLAFKCGITQIFVPCAWGDPLGIEFEGKSLPDDPTAEELAEDEEDFALWNWLLDDPLFELDKLTIRDSASATAKTGGATGEIEVPNPRQRPKQMRTQVEIECRKPLGISSKF